MSFNKHLFLALYLLVNSQNLFGQKFILSDSLPQNSISLNSFKDGEWFEFRIHYGFFNASYATMEISLDSIGDRSVFHAKAYARTIGLARLFFKVEDYYQSYFDQKNGLPYRFLRNIDEGGYTKNTKINVFPIKKNVQDLISAFYYLRNFFDVSKIEENQSIGLNMFFDKENYLFKLKFLGEEVLKTKFGNIKCLKFRPYVQSGRVFNEEESVTLWVSSDKNKLPIRLQADLAVGSIKCDLEKFKNLNYPFVINSKFEK